MKSIELDRLNRKYKCADYGKVPERSNENVLCLAAPHIDSFNFFLEEGLQAAVSCIPPVQFPLPNGDKVSLSIQNINIGTPHVSSAMVDSVDVKVYPKECIEKGSTYKAPMQGTISWSVNHKMKAPIDCQMGEIPMMVKSKKCNLYGMSPAELVRHGELVNETGGYFIINGGCRVLRLLIANRRNYPMAIIRNTWKKRDFNFSEKGVLMRCVSKDETTSVNILHHLTTGGVKLGFQIGKEIFLMPLMMSLKVLLNFSDKLVYQYLVRGRESDNYFTEKIKMMLRELQDRKLFTQQMCKDYIGKTFREKMIGVLPIWTSDEDVCNFLFQNYVLIHLNDQKSKFETLCMMARKLFSFIGGEILAESPDDISMQEATLGGYTYLQLIKQKLKDSLTGVKFYVLHKARERSQEAVERYVTIEADIRTGISRSMKLDYVIQTFIATGALPKNTTCGLMQTAGLTVMFDHLNRMRDLSHLRAIHRGSYFLDMKTIGPRRLCGEAWGFICPVHTPDGAPCGLLNHLAYHCVIPCTQHGNDAINRALIDLGMTSIEVEPLAHHSQCLEVVLDGRLAGYVTKEVAQQFTLKLRALKVKKKINKFAEIVLIEELDHNTQYPGLFICTSVARLMRPVINLAYGDIEYVGPMEQNYLNIAISPEDISPGIHTHMEIEKTALLSNIGKLVPFSDCNPNPRNMYQCQMGKQTMGTPLHNWRNQTFSKLYRLQYPQIPLVRNSHYDHINMEEFCMGFNAVLAIVSYTGYDMEDAMTINKCAMERGLAHGQVYKSEFVDLAYFGSSRRRNAYADVTHMFKRDHSNTELLGFLDENGLPYPGTKLAAGDPYYCVLDINQNTYKVVRYKGEDCVVDKYTIISPQSIKHTTLQKVNITIRIRRDPIIGDKFASRSGQKGVMSRLYPMEDLPFSERGIVPDIIFNPHGIPSRMTAGTLIDLVAGKGAAEFGKSFDSTPFGFNDENPAFDYYGRILEKAGFNYYGEDVLYSGTDGRMMEVQVFEGVVYYQRLRHMTADKWQVRSTGPMDTTTHQPIKGRKRGGAIRFGEMERDCLIAHGAAYTLRDRLLHCSDESEECVCANCGSIISPLVIGGSSRFSKLPECTACGPGTQMRNISMPYAFKFLVSELASVGIKTSLGVKTAEMIIREQNNNVCDKDVQEKGSKGA